MLPEVKDCAGRFRRDAMPELLGAAIPICGVAGDQQAATIGQACFEPGMMKSTYGTGCFALLNTGATAVASQQPAAHHHRLSARRQAHLCAGRRDLHRRRGGAMAARRLEDHQDMPPRRARWPRLPTRTSSVYLVPAFVGLGAPYWDAEARGAIFGLTRGTAQQGTGAGRAGSRLLPDPRPARGDAEGLGRARAKPSCASTAA